MKKRNMILNFRRCLFAMWLAVSLSTAAQRSYTLEECRQLAIENNLTLKNSAIDGDIAAQTSKEALTKYFPTVSASGTIMRANDYLVKMNMDLSALGVPAALPFNMIDRGKIASVMAIQPVFAGGRIVNSNKLARVGRDVANLRYAISENDVKLSVDKYFWQTVSLKEKMKTIDALTAQLNEIHKNVKNSVEAGVAMPNDLLKVELKQQEVESSRLKVENGLRLSKLMLCQKAGIEDAGFDISCDTFPEPAPPMKYFVDPSQGVERRTENRLLDAGVRAAQLQHKIAVGKNMPSIGVGAAYYYHDLLDKDMNGGIVFANVSIPISDWWGGSHAAKREKLKIRQAENSREDSQKLLRVDIESKWSNLQEAYSQILLAKRSITSSVENLRLNKDYYEAGTIALSELLDAQTALQQSRDRYTDACANYCVVLSEYLQSVGE